MKTNHAQACWSAPVNYGASKFEIQSTTNPARQIAIVNTLADAKLIAAAPELLAALENFITKNDPHGAFDWPEYRAARAAIAKARGE